MRRNLRIFWVIPLLVALSGCGAGAGLFKPRTAAATGGVAATAIPLDTSAIQTQTLGPAPLGSAPATARVIGQSRTAFPTAAAAPTPTPAQPSATAPQTAAEIGAAAAATLKASAANSTTATSTTATSTTVAPAAATPPAAPKSAQEAACINEGGRWGKAGNTSAETCFRPSKDGNKSCSKESDCTSQCLARSRTCAPFWPIFGCTEVIQNDGAVVRLCIE